MVKKFSRVIEHSNNFYLVTEDVYKKGLFKDGKSSEIFPIGQTQFKAFFGEHTDITDEEEVDEFILKHNEAILNNLAKYKRYGQTRLFKEVDSLIKLVDSFGYKINSDNKDIQKRHEEQCEKFKGSLEKISKKMWLDLNNKE